MNYRSCRPTKFILKGTLEELDSFTAQKLLLIAAHCTTVPFVCEIATLEECRQISNLPVGLVLLVVFHNSGIGGDKVIAVATSRAMMKAIASAAVNSDHSISASHEGLTGSSALNESMVDGWLSFVWNSFDLPFQAASLLLKDETISDGELEGVEDDLKNALKKIETHLSNQKGNRSFIMDPITLSSSTETFYSLADLSLAITIHFMLDKKIAVSVLSSDENPHLCRWKQDIHAVLGLTPPEVS